MCSALVATELLKARGEKRQFAGGSTPRRHQHILERL
ncbi:hypothetical protein OH492_19365 [Vibrio chagasii]|nr:hypothetical protein [Vibrio chagasii]